MSKSNVQDILKSLCKLYKGGAHNPYNTDGKTGEEYAKEYLRLQIWDAEYSVVTGYSGWKELWQREHLIPGLSKTETAEEVYKLAVRDKLHKMSIDHSHDWIQMYFDL